mmetsp:Transcript_41251/g.47522  ORF Transcript_41251/g.47522 Transcript_41251/m.47522 type:complete len:107 (-) Transcript_41251:44-364(-)
MTLKMAANNDLILILGSVILHNDMTRLISSEHFGNSAEEEREYYLNRADEIHDVLYKFSLKKFKTLAHQPEFSRVFEHYKSSIDMSQLSADIKIGFNMISEECGGL